MGSRFGIESMQGMYDVENNHRVYGIEGNLSRDDGIELCMWTLLTFYNGFADLSNSLRSSSLPTYSSRCLLAKSKTYSLGGASLEEQ